VYRFLDESGAVIYVGKARELRARLLSYFTAPWPESKAANLVRSAADIVWTELPSEFAALLLEGRLISRLRPRYNVRGAEGRSPMVFIKATAGTAMRLAVTAAARDGAARYYGPFRGRARTLDAVRVLSDLLGLRDCSDSRPMAFADQTDLFSAPLAAGCLRHELGACLGPCAARCSHQAYAERAGRALDFLEGRSAHPLDRVLEGMTNAADAREFERAAHWRGKFEALEWLFGAVARLRAAADALSFVYAVKDRTGGSDDRVYLLSRGVVKAEAAWPRTPLEREAFAADVRRYQPGDAAPPARTAAEMQQLLLVMSWFRQHPEEFEAATPYSRWTAAEP
jgi:excinuclease ABC subunit C